MGMYDKCVNCGYEEALHHGDTMQCPKCGSLNCWREKSPIGNTGCDDCGYVLDHTKSQAFDNYDDEKPDSGSLTCRICGKSVSAIEHIIYSKKHIQVAIETEFPCFSDDCRAKLILPLPREEAVKKYQAGAKL